MVAKNIPSLRSGGNKPTVGRVVCTHGFDTAPKGNLEIPASRGEGSDIRGVVKFRSWQKGIAGNLRSLRTMYNGLINILRAEEDWTPRDMARVSYYLLKYAEKLEGMAERTRRLGEELGGYHGFLPNDTPEELPPFKEYAEADRVNREGY